MDTVKTLAIIDVSHLTKEEVERRINECNEESDREGRGVQISRLDGTPVAPDPE